MTPVARTRAAMVTALVAVAAVGVGCGSSDSNRPAEAGGLTKVSAAMPPIANFVPIWLGRDKGIFEQHGIDLEIDENVAPSAIIPALVSGTLQGAGYAWGGQFVGNANKLPLLGIANLSTGGASDGEDDTQLVTLASSGITDPAQLKDKTIGLTTLGGALNLEVQTVLRKAGLGPRDYKLVSISPTDQPAALRAGRLDAAAMSEPFLTLLKRQSKINLLGGTHYGLLPSQPLINFVVTRDWAERHPEELTALQRALAESVDYANAHADETRKSIATNLKLPADVADSMMLPIFDATIDVPKLQRVYDALVSGGFADKPLKVADMIQLPSGCDATQPCSP